MDEFDLIATFFRPLAAGAESLQLSDDAALLEARLHQRLVVTSDMLHANVHFFSHDPPHSIAQKALRVNLSDLAAMGAEPYSYFLCLGLPKNTSEAWLRDFCAGLESDQQAYGIRLMGGDTTRTTGALSISITALGWVPTGGALLRSGAKAGDGLYVSGTIGTSALGLKHQQSAAHARYLLPQPRVTLGQALRGIASAAMDVSDGLLQDAAHLARASKVGLTIQASRIPLCPVTQEAIANGEFSLQEALTGGDDYELLFTAPANASFPRDVPITCIGHVHAGHDVSILDDTGDVMTFALHGYQHRFDE
ncbi:MAG: thiamine-phosphate kinase [Rickettsiales bacterium]|nr:thiamine-phosphate kinase [Rickettsiales bacterium]